MTTESPDNGQPVCLNGTVPAIPEHESAATSKHGALASVVDDLADSLANHRFQRRKADFKTGLRVDKNEGQEDRRRKRLEEQKQSRRDLTDHARALAFSRVSAFASSPESDEESSDEQDSSLALETVTQVRTSTKRTLEDDESDVDRPDVERGVDNIHKKQRRRGLADVENLKKKKRKKRNPYSGQLMIGEKLQKVPSEEELRKDWYCVVCPVGKRCLVVSSNGKTVSRLKSGRILDTFQSMLPAGSQSWRGNRTTDYCILDCIFDQAKLTYYVLDLMCWKGHPVYDCETEFRFYWAQTKFGELDPSLGSSNFAFPFIPLAVHPCDPNILFPIAEDPHAAAQRAGYKCDGLLLFHKSTHYEFGETPLVGWVPALQTRPILLGEMETCTTKK